MSKKNILIVVTVVLWSLSIFLGSLPIFPVVKAADSGYTFDLDRVKILDEVDARLTLADVVAKEDEAFVPFYDSEYVGRLASATYWVKIEFDHVNGDEILEVRKPQLAEVTLYHVNANGTPTQIETRGRAFGRAFSLLNHPNFIYPLKAQAHASTLYFKVQTDTYLQFPVVLWQVKHFADYLIELNLMHGIFYGVMLIMMLYNLTIGFALKDRTYVYYVLFVVCYTLLLAVWDGIAFVFFWPSAPIWDMRANPFFILTSALTLTVFTSHFLQLNTMKKWLKGLYGLIVATVAVGCVTVFTAPIAWALYLAMGATVLVIVYIGAGILTRGLREAADLVYISALQMLLIGNVLTLLAGVGVIPYNVFTMAAPKIGSIGLVVFFSLALVTRIKQTEYDRGLADEKSLLLKDLHDINKTINSTRELTRTVAPLIKTYQSMTGCDGGFVLLLDPEGQTEARVYYPDEQNKTLFFEPAQYDVFKTYLVRNKVAFMDAGEFHFLKLEKEVTTVVVVPLILYNRSVGAIVLTAHHLIQFKREIEEVALDYANQLAINIGNIHLLEKMIKTARTDALTGLHNRKYFMELADIQLKESGSLALLMLDIDYFKTVNDTYGHDVGDTILIEMCQRWSTVLAGIGEIGRYGGEEFIVFLNTASSSEVRVIAKALLETVSNEPFKVPTVTGGAIAATVSIGAASFSSPCTLEAGVKRADVALYQAKESGRNCVFYDLPEEV